MATKKKTTSKKSKGPKNFAQDAGGASRTTAAGMRKVNRPKYGK
jgi:hypothetical protein